MQRAIEPEKCTGIRTKLTRMHLVLSHSLYQHPNGRNGEKMRKIQLTVAQDEHNNYSH
jgi:hypothetical protein